MSRPRIRRAVSRNLGARGIPHGPEEGGRALAVALRRFTLDRSTTARTFSHFAIVGGFLILVALGSLVTRPAFAEVKWRSGAVDSPQPMKPADLRQAITDLAERPERSRIVIHFAGPLEGDRRETLAASGVRLMNYLGGYAFFATLTDQIDAADVSTIEGLLAVEADLLNAKIGSEHV